MNRDEEFVVKTRMVTIIDGEYRLTKSKENEKHGIAGKIGRVRGPVEGSGGRYWVQVDGDIYNLGLKSLDPRVVSGLHKVNYGAIVNSELFSHVTINCKKESRQNVENFLKAKGIRSEEKFSLLEDESTSLYIEVGQHLVVRLGKLSFTANYASNHFIFYTSPDMRTLCETFEVITGKSLWNILKVATSLELPWCKCGCKHQHWEEWDSVGACRITCPDCTSVLFLASGFENVPMEKELEKMVQYNKGRSRSYLRMISKGTT